MNTLPVLVDTITLSRLLGRPTGTIRRWAHEGRITALGRDMKGRSLYEWEAAQEVQRELTQGKLF